MAARPSCGYFLLKFTISRFDIFKHFHDFHPLSPPKFYHIDGEGTRQKSPRKRGNAYGAE